MLVASIDVGIIHLALVFARIHGVERGAENVHLVQAECVDTTHFEHDSIPFHQCTLGHTKTTADRIAHVVQQRRHLFDACTHVLIERQPLQGHTHVEQVLYLMLRDKAILVSPNAMHKFFNISHFTYEGRKEQVVRIVNNMLPPHRFPDYHALDRKHDVADALCLLLFWLHTHKPTKVQQPLPAPQECDENSHEKAVAAFANFTNKFRHNSKPHHVAACSAHIRPAVVGSNHVDV